MVYYVNMGLLLWNERRALCIRIVLYIEYRELRLKLNIEHMQMCSRTCNIMLSSRKKGSRSGRLHRDVLVFRLLLKLKLKLKLVLVFGLMFEGRYRYQLVYWHVMSDASDVIGLYYKSRWEVAVSLMQHSTWIKTSPVHQYRDRDISIQKNKIPQTSVCTCSKTSWLSRHKIDSTQQAGVSQP